jgi:caffeoyl-CoA O-methyltransferase
MKGAQIVGILSALTAIAVMTISLVPGPVWGKVGSRQRAFNLATSENPSLAKDDSEKRILRVLDDIDEGLATDEVHGRLLRILVESTKAKNVVEIGTGNGYSALWMCLGLKTTGGKLVTHEIDREKILSARANFKLAGVENLVTVVEGDAHQTVARLKDPIDILFMDAQGGNFEYLNQLLARVRPGGLILADNMRRPAPSPRYVKAITTNPNLETIFLNMQSTGISLTVKKD